MLKIYGIRNCDTMKRARVWLDARDVPYVFHDYKVSGVEVSDLDRWCGKLGWTRILNRAGTTFRALPDHEKADLDQTKAIQLMLAAPSMIKRPILEGDGALVVGFKEDEWAALKL
jgi:arsenate reductase (glutaredoxin)